MPRVYNDHGNGDAPPKDAVYIGRPSVYGNPFSHIPSFYPDVTVVDTREESIARYREYFYERIKTDPIFKMQVHELKGKDLICFCAPLPCHGDIILDYLSRFEEWNGLSSC